jgi:hypothetical protein
MRVQSIFSRTLIFAGTVAGAVFCISGSARGASISAQGSGAFFSAPTFATPGAAVVAQEILESGGNPVQNGAYTNQSGANYPGSTQGVAFTVNSPVDLTDFEANLDGGPGGDPAGNVNFTITFGTVNTSTGAFTAVSSENASQTYASITPGTSQNPFQPANNFEDFSLANPIPVLASAPGTEYGFVISENALADEADGSSNHFNSSSMLFSGANQTIAGSESLNSASGGIAGTVGTTGTDIDFVIGGTAYTVPEPASLGFLAIGGVTLLTRRRRSF